MYLWKITIFKESYQSYREYKHELDPTPKGLPGEPEWKGLNTENYPTNKQ